MSEVRTILAVDDEPEILELYRKLFSVEPSVALDILGDDSSQAAAPLLECRTYTDPQQMLEEYRVALKQGTRSPLCIVDMRMASPGEGLDTAVELRKIDQDIDIIFCTAVSHIVPEEIRQRLHERIFFVGKPFNNEEFTLLVHSLVDYWQSRQDLHRETAFVNSLFESVSDLVFVKDTKGAYLRCNKVFARFTGLTPEEVVGKSDKDFLSEEKWRMFQRQDERVFETGHSFIDRQWISYPDGSPCQLETVKSPLFSPSGECIGLIGVARDVTGRDRGASGYMI